MRTGFSRWGATLLLSLACAATAAAQVDPTARPRSLHVERVTCGVESDVLRLRVVLGADSLRGHTVQIEVRLRTLDNRPVRAGEDAKPTYADERGLYVMAWAERVRTHAERRPNIDLVIPLTDLILPKAAEHDIVVTVRARCAGLGSQNEALVTLPATANAGAGRTVRLGPSRVERVVREMTRPNPAAMEVPDPNITTKVELLRISARLDVTARKGERVDVAATFRRPGGDAVKTRRDAPPGFAGRNGEVYARASDTIRYEPATWSAFALHVPLAAFDLQADRSHLLVLTHYARCGPLTAIRESEFRFDPRPKPLARDDQVLPDPERGLVPWPRSPEEGEKDDGQTLPEPEGDDEVRPGPGPFEDPEESDEGAGFWQERAMGGPESVEKPLEEPELDELSANLLRAAYFGDEGMVRLLLQNGADPGASDDRGRTAMHWAALGGHAKVVARLAHIRGNDPRSNRYRLVHRRDLQGATPLHLAVLAGRVEVCSVLIHRGAHADAARGDGMTALHLAAIKGNEDLVGLLLRRGADPTARDLDGDRPHDLAEDERIARGLEEAIARRKSDPDHKAARRVVEGYLAALASGDPRELKRWAVSRHPGRESAPARRVRFQYRIRDVDVRGDRARCALRVKVLDAPSEFNEHDWVLWMKRTEQGWRVVQLEIGGRETER